MSATAATADLEYFRPAILDEILDGGHKVIDASAGTGKTFTIERIVVELLLTGAAEIDQILVVTFTEKATAELRARIRSAIEDVLSGRSAENARTPARCRWTLVISRSPLFSWVAQSGWTLELARLD